MEVQSIGKSGEEGADFYAAASHDIFDPAVVDRFIFELSRGSTDTAHFVLEAIHTSNGINHNQDPKYAFIRGVIWSEMVRKSIGNAEELRELFEYEQKVEQPTLFDLESAA